LLPLLLSAALWSPDWGWAKARPSSSTAHTTHIVYQGQTLGMIAKRYNVSVEALCSANAITRRSPIKPGQKLIVPDKNFLARDGRSTPKPKESSLRAGTAKHPTSPANASKTNTTSSSSSSSPSSTNRTQPLRQSWKKYVRPARRAGYVILRATGRSWQGYALVKGNRISPAGRKGVRRALYSWRTGAETDVDPRLIRLLIKVSDTFGGRPLKIVSGFRENSYARESKHKTGRACDLSVEGIPNEVLRDYLMSLDQVGVGYYPNSSFVHVDVRPESTHWVDRSAPGERPEYEHD
jgi:LysM repeat protein